MSAQVVPMVQLTMGLDTAKALRTLLGNLTPSRFMKDHPEDYLGPLVEIMRRDVADPYITCGEVYQDLSDILGTGFAGDSASYKAVRSSS